MHQPGLDCCGLNGRAPLLSSMVCQQRMSEPLQARLGQRYLVPCSSCAHEQNAPRDVVSIARRLWDRRPGNLREGLHLPHVVQQARGGDEIPVLGKALCPVGLRQGMGELGDAQ